MKAPKIPSFFKSPDAKKFSFKPIYYQQKKNRRSDLLEKGRAKINFKRNKPKIVKAKVRKYRILVLIIVLSLLAYKLLIN
tara:strand:- start:501 stop:740 length:240 start_codon:yes stop_codon:yes gene_type:complete